MIQPKRSKPENIERGQSLVELSIVLVILLILLAGIIDLGRAILAYFILQDAAEEGIIYGTSFPTDCDQIDKRIRSDVEHSIVRGSITVDIKIPDSTGIETSCYQIPYADVYATKEMTIEVAYKFPVTMPFFGSFLTCQDTSGTVYNCLPLKATAKGIILRPPEPTSTS